MTEETMQAEAEPVTNDAPVKDEPTVNPEGADQSPAEEEKVTFDERQQAVFDASKAKDTKKFHDKRREADGYKAELDRLKAAAPQPTRPVIPPMPDDTFADDYDEQVKAHIDGNVNAAAFDAEQKVLQKQSQKRQFETQQKTIGEFNKKAESYSSKAKVLNISPEVLRVAGESIVSAQIPNDVQMHILSHENGPLITEFLGNNFTNLDELSRLDSASAGAYISSTILPKALAVKRSTSAPNPADRVSGGSAPLRERGPKGATFE